VTVFLTVLTPIKSPWIGHFEKEREFQLTIEWDLIIRWVPNPYTVPTRRMRRAA
jgi:hypothetical protein